MNALERIQAWMDCDYPQDFSIHDQTPMADIRSLVEVAKAARVWAKAYRGKTKSTAGWGLSNASDALTRLEEQGNSQ